MIDLYRWPHNDCTIGRLTINKFQCWTLELPWKQNYQDISCIPTGTYDYYFRISPKNGTVLELLAVENRDYIQIHSGNFTYQILGCILVGDGFKWLDKDDIPDVTNSARTLKKLLKLAGKKGKIKIH